MTPGMGYQAVNWSTTLEMSSLGKNGFLEEEVRNSLRIAGVTVFTFTLFGTITLSRSLYL